MENGIDGSRESGDGNENDAIDTANGDGDTQGSSVETGIDPSAFQLHRASDGDEQTKDGGRRGQQGDQGRDGGSGETFAGTGAETSTGPEITGTGRGRPKGSRNKAKLSENALDLATEGKYILGALAGMISTFSRVPEFALEEEECEAIASAMADVAAFSIPTALDPKKAAIIKLGIRVGGVVAIHWTGYQLRKMREREYMRRNAPPQPSRTINPTARPTPMRPAPQPQQQDARVVPLGPEIMPQSVEDWQRSQPLDLHGDDEAA
jgi:hypothetical protein